MSHIKPSHRLSSSVGEPGLLQEAGANKDKENYREPEPLNIILWEPKL